MLEFLTPHLQPAAVSLRLQVRDFLAVELDAGHWTPQSNCWMQYDAAFSKRCGQAGFIGLTLPREYGGHGRGAPERLAVLEEMLAAGAPVGLHWIADRQSGPQIARHGSEEMRRLVLPRISAGECCIGIGMSEPDAGSDLAAVRSRGIRVDGGWRLTGSKLWTSHAHRAQYIIALVRTEAQQEQQRHAGLTQFLIDMRSAGVTTSPITDLTGQQDFNEVLLDDVFVADACLIGKPGDGWKLVNAELAFERSGPERFMSTVVLLEAAATQLGYGAGVGASTSAEAAIAIGRLVSHLVTLRYMSGAIAGLLDRGASPDMEAALVKDLGGMFEREIPEVVRQLIDIEGAASSAVRNLQDASVLSATSFTLRGGTREILRGIVAKRLRSPRTWPTVWWSILPSGCFAIMRMSRACARQRRSAKRSGRPSSTAGWPCC